MGLVELIALLIGAKLILGKESFLLDLRMLFKSPSYGVCEGSV